MPFFYYIFYRSGNNIIRNQNEFVEDIFKKLVVKDILGEDIIFSEVDALFAKYGFDLRSFMIELN